jgi:BlaI family transcriptional regulator, penicillinase repressor
MAEGKPDQDLTRRERQIMDALYRLGKASAANIRESLANPPSYTAVRTHLTLLQDKGLVRFESDGTRYIYEPTVPREETARTVMKGVLQTFFENSVEKAVATLIDRDDEPLSKTQLDRLAAMIEQARKDGR